MVVQFIGLISEAPPHDSHDNDVDDDEAAMRHAMLHRVKGQPMKAMKAMKAMAAMKAMKAIKADATIIKKPAAANASKQVVMTRPAACAGRGAAAPIGVLDGSGGVKHPKAPLGSAGNPPPSVTYRGAYCYTSWPKRKFRIVLNPASCPSDKSFNWNIGRDAAWAAALAWIDDQRRK